MLLLLSETPCLKVFDELSKGQEVRKHHFHHSYKSVTSRVTLKNVFLFFSKGLHSGLLLDLHNIPTKVIMEGRKLLVGFGNQRALRTDTGEGVECLLQTGRKLSQLKNKMKTQ